MSGRRGPRRGPRSGYHGGALSDSRAVVDLVAGARPNFMKVAPILRAMGSSAGPLAARLVHTGQHYDEGMSAVFFRDLGIREPDVSLGVGSGTHGQQTARILAAYEEHLLSASPRPAAVVVVGDVNSTMACTLAAVKLSLPVAHVEAGLKGAGKRTHRAQDGRHLHEVGPRPGHEVDDGR